LIPEPSSWNVDGRATTIPGNVPSSSRANTNSMVNPPAGSPFIAHQNLHRRNPRNLSEVAFRLLSSICSIFKSIYLLVIFLRFFLL
jgi:hypothetical protein